MAESSSKKKLDKFPVYITLLTVLVLIILGFFVSNALFLYHAVNDPFTFTKKDLVASTGSADLAGFDKQNFNFVLKSMNIDPAKKAPLQAQPPAAAQAVPDYKIQILNSVSKSLLPAEQLKTQLDGAGLDVGGTGLSAVRLVKTQIRVKDSLRVGHPEILDQIQKITGQSRVLDAPQTLEESSSFDVVIILGSARK